MIKKFLTSSLFTVSVLFANQGGDYIPHEADCLVIKDENSIICKYKGPRTTEDRFINVEWINPKGEVSRSREIVYPSGHGSVYDFRYLEGRMKGTWQFNVVDGENKASTNFEIE